jgi:hypothetical protein
MGLYQRQQILPVTAAECRKKFFTIWTFFSVLIEISPSPYIKCVRSDPTFRNHPSRDQSRGQRLVTAAS